MSSTVNLSQFFFVFGLVLVQRRGLRAWPAAQRSIQIEKYMRGGRRVSMCVCVGRGVGEWCGVLWKLLDKFSKCAPLTEVGKFVGGSVGSASQVAQSLARRSGCGKLIRNHVEEIALKCANADISMRLAQGQACRRLKRGD